MSLTWPDLTTRVIAREDLSSDDTAWAMDQVMSGQTPPTVLAGFLTALATKGETTEELRGLADMMLEHAKPVGVTRDAVDIVGTGGDRLKTVNISTTASIIMAAAGVNVVKHGNRASSSSSGSADCLEQLGIDLNISLERAMEIFNEIGITFLFANLVHPSMRYAAAARRDLAVSTAFNILGPLTNPARPRSAAIGVYSQRHAPIVAGVLAGRGTSALVFRGMNGMDELSAVCPNQVWEVRGGEITYSDLDAVRDLGLTAATVDDLRGGDAEHNAAVSRAVFDGQQGPVRESVVLNAAAGLVAEGSLISEATLIDRLAEGMEIARNAIDTGKATELIDRWAALAKA